VCLAALALALGAGAGKTALGRGDELGPARDLSPIGEAFPLVFDSETIRLDVRGDSAEVIGTFTFRCRGAIDEPIPLFFPFPSDSLLGGARMVSLAYRMGAQEAIAARWEVLPGAPGVRWWVPPCEGDSLVAAFVYRQALVTGYARYILTTARLWGRPIRYAIFEIRLPAGAHPTDWSYPLEPSRDPDRASYASYFFEVRDLFPDRDLIVRWSGGAGKGSGGP
jgi:hypothetical protein